MRWRLNLTCILISGTVMAPSCASQSEARIPGPAIVQVGTTYQLILPDTLASAIQLAVPGFEAETLVSYNLDVQKYYQCTSRQAPWAVVGDFNGDGIQDVIVDGHVGDRHFRLCLWGATATVDTLLTSVGDPTGTASYQVLMYAAPGEQRTNFSDSTIFIHTDAYLDYYFEKGGFLRYWKDGEWNQWLQSD